MNAKSWYALRTVWFYVVTLAVAGADVLLDPALVQDSRIVAGATAVGNVALRLLTNVPIAGTPADVTGALICGVVAWAFVAAVLIAGLWGQPR